MLLDHKQDESYTPSKLAVRAGSNFQDLTVSMKQDHQIYAKNKSWMSIQIALSLQQIAVVEFTEPEGWVDIELIAKNEK